MAGVSSYFRLDGASGRVQLSSVSACSHQVADSSSWYSCRGEITGSNGVQVSVAVIHLYIFMITVFSRIPIIPLPFHLELASYFHVFVDLYRQHDADPRDFSTLFGSSAVPEFLLHLVLQRTDDERLKPSCPATLLPPALRPSVPEDIMSRYESMSYDPALARLLVQNLDFGQQLPSNVRDMIVEDLIKEQKQFILHL